MIQDSDIIRQVRLGEDSVLELKEVQVPGHRVTDPGAHDMADEFAAAANTFGATFLLGVNDRTREIVGIPEDKLDVVETWVRDICNDSIKPSLVSAIRKLWLQDESGTERCVIRVDVPKSLFVHKSPHGYFHRIGSSKREMSPETLARLFQQRSQTRFICFDEQVVASADMSELKRELFDRFRTSLSSADDAEFLRKLHFVASGEDGVLRPTVGGILMASEHPEAHLPSAFIQAVCYRGTTRNADEQVDAKDFTGPLDRQVFDACRFVTLNMRVAAVKTPARIDIPQYAMNAVFEAIVNAVAHRDYSVTGSKIRLQMFADRLEIYSPGGLPNSLTLDEITERQFSRNELICTCLSRCPLKESFTDVVRSQIMDRRGEGVPIIFSASEKLTKISPEYTLLDNDELKLVLHSVPVEDAVAVREIAMRLYNGSDQKSGKWTETKILGRLSELIEADPHITQQDMAKACGVSRGTIVNWLKRLNGKIKHIGADSKGTWVLDLGSY